MKSSIKNRQQLNPPLQRLQSPEEDQRWSKVVEDMKVMVQQLDELSPIDKPPEVMTSLEELYDVTSHPSQDIINSTLDFGTDDVTESVVTSKYGLETDRSVEKKKKSKLPALMTSSTRKTPLQRWHLSVSSLMNHRSDDKQMMTSQQDTTTQRSFSAETAPTSPMTSHRTKALRSVPSRDDSSRAFDFFRALTSSEKYDEDDDQFLGNRYQVKMGNKGNLFATKGIHLRRKLTSADKKLISEKPVTTAGKQLQSFREPQTNFTNVFFPGETNDNKKPKKQNRFKKGFKTMNKQISEPSNQNQNINTNMIWETSGGCIWFNSEGQEVILKSTNLSELSELECQASQKVAVEKIEKMDFGFPVVVPKDESSTLKHKLRRRYIAFASAKEKIKNTDHVFGIPLVQVVENDQLLRLQKSEQFAPTINRDDYVINDVINNSPFRGSSTFDVTSCGRSEDSTPSCSSVPHTPQISRVNYDAIEKDASPFTLGRPLRRRGGIGPDSIQAIDPSQSQLLQALSLSVTRTDNRSQLKKEKASLLPPTMSQAPYVVQKCCDYITKHGLDVVGIFRIAGSKKRVKQLREEFDRGVDVTIKESYNPHDVAALLKEFFRDLPEALLTRELYPSFIRTMTFSAELRTSILRYLLWLLPIPNRDSLQTLLRFLNNVAQHSEERVDEKGQKIGGNKMTFYNLAAIFGPNILHKFKKASMTSSSSTSQASDVIYQSQASDGMEDCADVIRVVENLIRNHNLLFELSKEDHNEILQKLKLSEPAAVDFILRRKESNYSKRTYFKSADAFEDEEVIDDVRAIALDLKLNDEKKVEEERKEIFSQTNEFQNHHLKLMKIRSQPNITRCLPHINVTQCGDRLFQASTDNSFANYNKKKTNHLKQN